MIGADIKEREKLYFLLHNFHKKFVHFFEKWGGDFLMKDMGTNGNLSGGVLGFINLTSKIDHTPTQYGGILHAISTRHRCN